MILWPILLIGVILAIQMNARDHQTGSATEQGAERDQ